MKDKEIVDGLRRLHQEGSPNVPKEFVGCVFNFSSLGGVLSRAGLVWLKKAPNTPRIWELVGSQLLTGRVPFPDEIFLFTRKAAGPPIFERKPGEGVKVLIQETAMPLTHLGKVASINATSLFRVIGCVGIFSSQLLSFGQLRHLFFSCPDELWSISRVTGVGRGRDTVVEICRTDAVISGLSIDNYHNGQEVQMQEEIPSATTKPQAAAAPEESTKPDDSLPEFQEPPREKSEVGVVAVKIREQYALMVDPDRIVAGREALVSWKIPSGCRQHTHEIVISHDGRFDFRLPVTSTEDSKPLFLDQNDEPGPYKIELVRVEDNRVVAESSFDLIVDGTKDRVSEQPEPVISDDLDDYFDRPSSERVSWRKKLSKLSARLKGGISSKINLLFREGFWRLLFVCIILISVLLLIFYPGELIDFAKFLFFPS